MARSKKSSPAAPPENPGAAAFAAGQRIVGGHPILRRLLGRMHVRRSGPEAQTLERDAWAYVTDDGRVVANARRHGEPEEWAYVLAACALHLGFGHFERGDRDPELWTAAGAAFVARFLQDLRIGRAPEGLEYPADVRGRSTDEFYTQFAREGVPERLAGLGVGGRAGTLRWNAPAAREPMYRWGGPVRWPELLSQGIDAALERAVEVAAGLEPPANDDDRPAVTAPERARRWFMSQYPLLGGLAAGFKILEDPTLCQRLDISVAAVSSARREIYANPAAGLDEMEWRFVIAHEILHVALQHSARRDGRDPFLWNVAVDFLTNQWLVELGIGRLPKMGVLYDPELGNRSSEDVYAQLAADERRSRRLRTFRGTGEGDILDDMTPDWWTRGDGVHLSEFCRRALVQGLALHEQQARGTLPAGLAEAIRALETPPPAWDVRLGRWFQHVLPRPESRRTYARAGRRQSSTPNIPRPARERLRESGLVFGVVLDTSWSMDPRLLGLALGAIAGYAAAHDVEAVRLMCCDARAHDLGYVAPEALAQTVEVQGRGGTVLQPGIDALLAARDFPKDAPVLVITDGECDTFAVPREHAVLLPRGARLPFTPVGPVFELSELD